jgi:hypothetical protein
MTAPQQAITIVKKRPMLVEVVMSPNPALDIVITVKNNALNSDLKSSWGGSKQ